MRLGRALRAVLSACFGVRRASQAEADRRLKPYELIGAALILLALLLAILLLIVRQIVAGAGG